MVITALGVTLLFVSLGLATALLAAIHDAIEAMVHRRQMRPGAHLGGAEGGVPLAASTPRRAARRGRRVPSAALTAGVPAKSTYTVEPSPTPAWVEIARRDLMNTGPAKR
jgi:hypothetical protein